MKNLLVLIFIFLAFKLDAQITNTPLAGKPLEDSPWFQYINNFQSYDTVFLGIDPNRYPNLINQNVSVYIIESKTPDSLVVNPFLIDVRGMPQDVYISGSGIQDNIFMLHESYLLEDQSWPRLGVAYDIVLDVDNNNLLSPGDIIDGWNNTTAGFYKIHNTAAPGPFEAVVNNYYDGDPWLNKRIYYPQNIESLQELPLIIVSHGWTYDYFMYNYIGEHLATYGYIVVIHANNVGSGGPAATHSASLTTLNNTDHFIGAQSSMLDGIFDGHIDNNKIAFLGHSTGGEGIVRAYTRVMNYEYLPVNFELEDIKILCPFAPTAWLTKEHVDPGSTNFHMFSAGADADCSLFAAPESGWQQSFSIFERSKGNRQLTYIHGAGHTDLNSCGPECNQYIDPQAPGLIGAENTHLVVKSYLLPLLELYLNENSAGKEYFTRMYDDFHPIGIPDTVFLAKEFKLKEEAYKLVIDDFQTNYSLDLSSSGTLVSYFVDNIFEIEMRDNDQSFNWTGNQQSNGFTRSKVGDDTRCVILDWDEDGTAYYSVDIPEFPDTIIFEYLSFRVSQGTRHPNTDLLHNGLSFIVNLEDESGNIASISTKSYGLINQPYQRSGGWVNEFETIIIRLSDFAIDYPDINIKELSSIQLNFGTYDHSANGRLAIDDIEFISERETFIIPFTTDISSTIQNPHISIYPNPATETISIQGLSRENNIHIINYLGQVVMVIPTIKETINLDICDLNKGIYYLRVISKKDHLVEKFIKH